MEPMALLAGRKGFSVVGVSVLGGAMHNVGQLLAAVLVVENFQVIYYLPPLLAGGVVTGLLRPGGREDPASFKKSVSETGTVVAMQLFFFY